MKICIIGNGLVSLTLANVLIQKEISVDIFSSRKNDKYHKTRTLGISKSNIDYFNEEIMDIKKISWEIKNIKIFTEKYFNQEILNFNNNEKQIFSIIKNYKLYKVLVENLKKNKLVKFKKIINFKNFNKKKYNLIINCDAQNQITKDFFYNKIEKNYNSYAYISTIDHKKLSENNIAYQNFTNRGPIAFLPISNTQTSVVYSLRIKNYEDTFDVNNLIKKYNPGYIITKINKGGRFELKSSMMRKYYNNNILAFGDLLHKIHPLAGQGFNMSLRDVKLLSKLIDERINFGLDIDSSVCREFQKKAKDKNYVFSSGIDWIYELFNFESKINSNLISRSINVIGKNKIINSFFKKFADSGLRI